MKKTFEAIAYGAPYKRYESVNRQKAKRLFNEGKVIFLCPSKTNPCSMFGNICSIEKNDETFEQIENAFSYYNCNAETGKRITFYIRTQ